MKVQSTPKVNSEKFVWTDPSQLREVNVASESTRVPDPHYVSSSATGRVSISASESNPPPLTGNLKDD